MESLSPHEPKTFSFPNGALKKHHPRHPPPPAAAAPHQPDLVEYKDCLKNHAAALGGHAVDGCGEFMPSPFSDPAVPTSLTCSACGCHRNFHRRLIHHHHHPKPALAAANGDGHDDADDADDESSDEEDEGGAGAPRARRSRSRSPPPYSSAPHMLLALSGGGGGEMGGRSAPTVVAPPPLQSLSEQHRRRARTKFSPDQKARMHELSEKLGWRMPKRDDGSLEDFCRQIGVEKGVFKVWMHNNKQNFAGSSASAAAAGPSGTANTSSFSTRTLPLTDAGSGDMNGIGDAGGDSRFGAKDSPSS